MVFFFFLSCNKVLVYSTFEHALQKPLQLTSACVWNWPDLWWGPSRMRGGSNGSTWKFQMVRLICSFFWWMSHVVATIGSSFTGVEIGAEAGRSPCLNPQLCFSAQYPHAHQHDSCRWHKLWLAWSQQHLSACRDPECNYLQHPRRYPGLFSPARPHWVCRMRVLGLLEKRFDGKLHTVLWALGGILLPL